MLIITPPMLLRIVDPVDSGQINDDSSTTHSCNFHHDTKQSGYDQPKRENWETILPALSQVNRPACEYAGQSSLGNAQGRCGLTRVIHTSSDGIGPTLAPAQFPSVRFPHRST